MSFYRFLELRLAVCVLCIYVFCVDSSSSAGDTSNRLLNGIRDGRLRSREWDTMHHVVRDLLSTRVNPDTGKERHVSETLRDTALAKAEGIFTVLGRTRVAKRNNKLRFDLASLVNSRQEDYPGKDGVGYVAPAILQAELRVFKTPAHMPVTQRQGVKHANITITSPAHRGVLAHKVVSLSHNSWEVINVTDFVKQMIKSPSMAINFGFHAHSTGPSHSRLSVSSLLQLGGDSSNTQRPLLVIYLREPVEPLLYVLSKMQEAREVTDRKKREAEALCPEERQKREAAEERSANVTQNAEVVPDEERYSLRADTCRLHPFFVDFQAIGWDHIIAPLAFDPKICSGNCYDPFVSSTNHAIVRSWAFRNEHPELVGSPIPTVCCTPTHFSSTTLVSKEGGGEVLKFDTYYDMVAEACGCR